MRHVPVILLAPLLLAGCGYVMSGTWDDDAGNWKRAFGSIKPDDVTVVHSKYWKSNHFTEEHMYYFEIEAAPEWRDIFLKQRGFAEVSPTSARSFRMNNHDDGVPDWFAPDPVGLYDVWDNAGFGSVWINKTTGHIFFYE